MSNHEGPDPPVSILAGQKDKLVYVLVMVIVINHPEDPIGASATFLIVMVFMILIMENDSWESCANVIHGIVSTLIFWMGMLGRLTLIIGNFNK